MSVPTDQENARAALELCRSFEGRPLASGHSVVVDSGPELSHLGLRPGAAELVSLAITDRRLDGTVTLFAVRCQNGKVEIRYLREGQRETAAVPDGVNGLKVRVDDLLEDVDAEQVDKAMANFERYKASL
jgi:hypothetical protein